MQYYLSDGILVAAGGSDDDNEGSCFIWGGSSAGGVCGGGGGGGACADDICGEGGYSFNKHSSRQKSVLIHLSIWIWCSDPPSVIRKQWQMENYYKCFLEIET